VTTLSLIVPAAGCGSRAQTSGNKILALIGGRPLLWHTLRALLAPAAYDQARPIELLIAAQPDEFALIQPLLDELKTQNSKLKTQLVFGGATRQESVFNALKAAQGDLVLVHDAARPLVSPEVIARTLDAALKSGAALAALPCPDTVKQANAKGTVAATLDRSILWLAQTPQIFRRDLLLAANEKATADGFAATDCASIVEHLGHAVRLVPGEARNFKVTYPDDLERAAALLKTEPIPL
jgi:2-C-methyl-D-erythritol 4-phosphate cytidylyltransferase